MNKVMIKTKTVFFYLYKILNFFKQINAYLVAGAVIFVVLHAAYRIYEGSNKYVDYLNENPQQMLMLLVVTIMLYYGYSMDKKIKLRLGILAVPSIFLFVTYYISFAFSLEYYITLPAMLSSLVALTLLEKVCKKFRFKYILAEIVSEEYETNESMVQEAKLCV